MAIHRLFSSLRYKWVRTRFYARGCEYPLSGTAYVGVLAYLQLNVTSGSEYIYQQLNQPLTQGQQYYVEFWISAADDAYYNTFVKHLGMYFTSDINSISNGAFRGLHHLTPQIPNTFPAQSFYNKLNGWQKVSGYYTPTTSNIRYIIIGNFDPGINNSTPSPSLQYRTPPIGDDAAFYFIDAVTIIPANQTPPLREMYISGPNVVCTTSAVYTLNNVPVGSTVTWQATPANLFATSSGNGSSATLAAANSNTSGQGTLTYTIQTACGNVPIEKTITVGRRSPTGFIVVIVDPWLRRIKAMVEPVPEATGYEWYLNGVKYTGPGMNSDYVTMPISNSCSIPDYSIGVKAINPCGASATYSEIHANPCYQGGFLTYYPNPATDILTVESKMPEDMYSEGQYELLDSGTETTHPFTLYDFSRSKIVLQGTLQGKTEIDVSALGKGRYVLKVQINKGREENHHIVVDK